MSTTAATLARRQSMAAKNRRMDRALIDTVGVVEAVLLAKDENTAVRRASVALGYWSEDGLLEEHAMPAQVSKALTGWYKLRGPEPDRFVR